jgi:anaerobic selenocysteine-containing dehydrogenase
MSDAIEIVRTNCPRDCYDGCGIVVERRGEGTVRVLGDRDHPVSRGTLCGKCAVAYNGVWQDESARLLHPMKRVGPKGAGRFERIGWPEAIETIATRLRDTISRHGPESVVHTHYSGTLSLIAYAFPMRFFHRLGAVEVEPDTICNMAGHVAWSLLFGNSYVGFDPRTARDASCILVWGANPAHSAPHAHKHWLPDAPAQTLVVDPIRTETAAAADLHLQPFPGTDAALAFSLLHVLERDGMLDTAFIAEHTLGADEVLATLGSCTPEWGEATTRVPAADIERAAQLYGAGPSLLWVGQGMQRQLRGGNAMRAVGLLPALTGNVGKPGAGFYYLNMTPGIAGIDLGDLMGATLRSDDAASVSHMDFAARLAQPDLHRALFCWNTNPAASAPDQRRLRSALSREDLFTVAIDCFPTDTADYADILLPAASFLEFDDLTFNYFHLHIGAQVKAREAPGEALPNQEIFRRLARAMEFEEPALYEEDRLLLDRMLEQMNVGFGFDELARRGWLALSEEPLVLHGDRRFGTPSGKIEIASERAVQMGLPRVPEPWADANPADGRLRLLTPASKWRLNDSYANDAQLSKRAGEASVRLSPDDAARLGIGDGARVRLTSDVGELELAARIDAMVPLGVALSYKGRWPKREAQRANVNALTPARKSDMGEGTSVHSTEVSVSAC